MGAGYLLGLRLSWPAGVYPRGVWEHAGQAETSSEMRRAMGEYRVGVGNPSHMLLASPGDAMEMPRPPSERTVRWHKDPGQVEVV